MLALRFSGKKIYKRDDGEADNQDRIEQWQRASTPL